MYQFYVYVLNLIYLDRNFYINIWNCYFLGVQVKWENIFICYYFVKFDMKKEFCLKKLKKKNKLFGYDLLRLFIIMMIFIGYI